MLGRENILLSDGDDNKRCYCVNFNKNLHENIVHNKK